MPTKSEVFMRHIAQGGKMMHLFCIIDALARDLKTNDAYIHDMETHAVMMELHAKAEKLKHCLNADYRAARNTNGHTGNQGQA